MHRELVHLQSCGRLSSRPKFIPQARGLRGTKAKGLQYEKRVGKILGKVFPEVHSGQWFEYRDKNGVGCCQPDHFVVLPRVTLLIECKLSERESAWAQMHQLYRPILEIYYRKPVICVQACRHLTTGRGLILDIREALLAPARDHLWHLLV